MLHENPSKKPPSAPTTSPEARPLLENRSRKHLANWWLWIVVDTLEIGIFFYKHLYLTSVLFAFFVFLALLGLRAWKQALREQQSGKPHALPVRVSDLAVPKSNFG